jgi:hypothetical protein
MNMQNERAKHPTDNQLRIQDTIRIYEELLNEITSAIEHIKKEEALKN